jgi:hypothetical protein
VKVEGCRVGSGGERRRGERIQFGGRSGAGRGGGEPSRNQKPEQKKQKQGVRKIGVDDRSDSRVLVLVPVPVPIPVYLTYVPTYQLPLILKQEKKRRRTHINFFKE